MQLKFQVDPALETQRMRRKKRCRKGIQREADADLGSSLSQMGEIEAGAYCLDLMDLVIDQALDYLDRFDQPYGLLIILNQCPIKKK